MSEVKRCVQCGMLKEEGAFRKYTYSKTKGTEGRYRICKSCEAINQAYRRAHATIDETGFVNILTEGRGKAIEIIRQTDKLYAVLEARGLRVPPKVVSRPKEETVNAVDSLLEFYEAEVPTISTDMIPTDIPDELQSWLEADMQEWLDNNLSPEYLQETIYESLKAKYRPQVSINKDTFMPIYDDTYKAILNQILRRFDDYEETCSLEG